MITTQRIDQLLEQLGILNPDFDRARARVRELLADDAMAVAEAVRVAMVQSCESWPGIVEATKRVDLAAIVEAVQPATKPEPVIKQLLAALHECMDAMLDVGVPIDDSHPHRVAFEDARAAIAAAEAAQQALTPPADEAAPDDAKEYCWSNNGEEYHGSFASVEEALDDYLKLYDVGDAAHIHIGEAKHHTPGNPTHLADDVLDQLNCQAADEAGEWADTWPDLPADKRAELGRMIQDYVWKHDAPTFYAVENAVLYDVATRQPVAAQKPDGV